MNTFHKLNEGKEKNEVCLNHEFQDFKGNPTLDLLKITKGKLSQTMQEHTRCTDVIPEYIT
jgi:hypothetical protein